MKRFSLEYFDKVHKMYHNTLSSCLHGYLDIYQDGSCTFVYYTPSKRKKVVKSLALTSMLYWWLDRLGYEDCDCFMCQCDGTDSLEEFSDYLHQYLGNRKLVVYGDGSVVIKSEDDSHCTAGVDSLQQVFGMIEQYEEV